MAAAIREETGARFLDDLRSLGHGQRERVRRCMAEIRADPLTLRDGWRLLPFPFQPGTTVASLGDIDVRFVVSSTYPPDRHHLTWRRVPVVNGGNES